MSPERWRQVEEIFQSALERDPAKRAAFLDGACAGDPTLRAEVEALLAADERAGSLIEPEALGITLGVLADAEAVSVGQAVGHYNILAPLGAGGMGEVYLAQDTRLGRKLALKLLPASFTQDGERVRRFRQEARAASALNHPNIITVYEVGQVDSRHFIATEFVDGETLREVLRRGAYELRALLGLLAQAADGLAKAHEAGIVHRDLKPDNIMVTRDGYAKVLDFGLAKLVEPRQPSGGDPREAPTALLEQTQSGLLMGTAGYISPEQAKGKEVDQRSDIFSFGCILYEAATGRQPFEGETLVDALHKVLHETAPPVSEFNPGCPAELQRIIRKCMAKDRQRRYQSIKEVAIDLRELSEGFDAGEAPPAPARPATLMVAAAKETAEQPAHDTAEVAPTLTDSDPEVLRATRFLRASVLLAILGIVGAIALWPAYRWASVESEFRLECPKDAALSKAREIVRSFGYDPVGLEEFVQFKKADFDLERVATEEGLAAARRAVGEGKVGQWKVTFMRPITISEPRASLDELRRGELSVLIDPRGRMVSFLTPPREGAAVAELEREQAIKAAEETVRRVFSLDPGGYEIEFIRKSNPPGVVEITWRNPAPAFVHREVVRADFQGDRVIRLSRIFEPLPESSDESEKNGVQSAVSAVKVFLVFLCLIATVVLGIVFLIKGRRWYALRQRLAVAAGVSVILYAVAVSIVSMNDTPFSPLIILLVMILFALPFGALSFVTTAGVMEYLRTVNPVRLHGAAQLMRGRFLSKPAAASLVHGVLGGALMAGIGESLGVLMAMVPGYSPQTEAINVVQIGSLYLGILFILTTWTLGVLPLAVLVELVEKMVRGHLLRTLIPVLLISILGSDYFMGPPLRVLALGNLSTFLLVMITVHLYRSWGIAAAYLALVVYNFLKMTVIAHNMGDPGYVFQANLILFGVCLLLATGVWGYVRERVRENLPALGIR